MFLNIPLQACPFGPCCHVRRTISQLEAQTYFSIDGVKGKFNTTTCSLDYWSRKQEQNIYEIVL